MKQITIAANAPVSASAPSPIYISEGIVVFGSILFSAVSSAIVISFFLSGLKSSINELKLTFDSKLKELEIEQKNSVEKVLIHLEHRDEEIEEIKARQGRIRGDFCDLVNFINSKLEDESKIFKPRKKSPSSD